MAKAVVSKGNGNESESELVYGKTVFLDPGQLIEDENINVRPWSSSEDETEQIKELAQAIYDVGQIHPVSVRVVHDADGGLAEYRLFIGRRRWAAVRMINEQLVKKNTAPMTIECKVYDGLSDDDAFRMAAAENSKRKDANPMDNALNIANAKAQHGWTGSKEVSEYFEMSRAWVSQHEKLLGLDKEIQGQVGQGLLSADAAFKMVNVKPEKRKEVFEQAQRLQEEETPVASATVEAAAGDGMPKKKKIVKARHITAAARKVEGAEQTLTPRKAREIVEFFQRFDSLEYGFKNGAVRDFIGYLTEKWAKGGGTDRTLTEKFDRMVEMAVSKDPGKDDGEAKAKAAEKTVNPKAKVQPVAPKGTPGKKKANGKAKPKK